MEIENGFQYFEQFNTVLIRYSHCRSELDSESVEDRMVFECYMSKLDSRSNYYL